MRFNNNKSSYCEIYYDLPSTKTSRFAGIGKGERGDFIKVGKNPAPGTYNPSNPMFKTT